MLIRLKVISTFATNIAHEYEVEWEVYGLKLLGLLLEGVLENKKINF
jgi:hypothetical protein